MSNNNGIEIDLGRVKAKTFAGWIINPESYYCLFQVLDEAVVGGMADRPMTDLPAATAKFQEAIAEFSVNVKLAVASMSQYLKDNKGV